MILSYNFDDMKYLFRLRILTVLCWSYVGKVHIPFRWRMALQENSFKMVTK